MWVILDKYLAYNKFYDVYLNLGACLDILGYTVYTECTKIGCQILIA